MDDDQHVKGVIGQRQLLKAMASGVDASSVQCHEHMEMDFMKVKKEDSLKRVLADIQTRSPQAVVAVDENDEFIGYFSPGDYQEAVQLVSNLKGLDLRSGNEFDPQSHPVQLNLYGRSVETTSFMVWHAGHGMVG